MIPDDLKFTETHEWVRAEEDSSTATIGLSAYAAEQLGDVVYLELPAVGDAVKQGEPFGVIESVKAAFDLNSPIGGEVIEVNEPLLTELDKIAEDPCGEGWMIKMKIENKDELKSLMDSTEYEKLLKTKKD